MKALLCAKCFDIRALDPDGGWTTCRCQNMEARWENAETGKVRVRAKNKSYVRIIGMNNRFLMKAVGGFDVSEIKEHGGGDGCWKKLHDEATNAKGYIFDKDFRDCWACVIQVGETGDVKWEDPVPLPPAA